MIDNEFVEQSWFLWLLGLSFLLGSAIPLVVRTPRMGPSVRLADT